MHGEGLGVTREELVRQSRERTASVFDLASYVPIGQALPKPWHWQAQGPRIAYLGPSRKPENMAKNEQLLWHLGFPPGTLHHRGPDETYAMVVERVGSDVLIEDDCESIGGAAEMATPHLSPEARTHFKATVVPEFGGIDRLPDDPAQLLSWVSD